MGATHTPIRSQVFCVFCGHSSVPPHASSKSKVHQRLVLVIRHWSFPGPRPVPSAIRAIGVIRGKSLDRLVRLSAGIARALANLSGWSHILPPVTPCYHQTIDARLLRLVEVSIQKIDANPALVGQLVQNVARWPNPQLQAQWRRRLQQPWPALRAELLAETEQGAALRQDAPLGGILSVAERAQIMREFAHDARPA